MSRKANVLITCIGGRYTYDLVRAIEAIKNFSIGIFGADSNPKSNIPYIKKIYKIPRTNREKVYIKKIFSICKKKKINIIFPGSENESILFSKNKKIFEKKKIRILISNYKIVSQLNDKGKMLEFLEKKNINVGKWKTISSPAELKKALQFIGYPQKKVVLKQRKGSGSRGVIILDKNIKKFKLLLPNRFCGTGNINSVRKEFKKRKIKFTNLICMPYYGGDTYDVDCLAFNGVPNVVIPRLRKYENPLSPFNEGCILENNYTIINYVKKIIRAFKIHGACDFDVVLDNGKKPKILDSSNRMSGSVGASFVAGYNLPEQIIKYSMGLKTKKVFPSKKNRLFPVNKFVLI